MVEELRKRNNKNGTELMTESAAEFTHGVGLSAPSLMRASPGHHGPALKLHVPLIYSILPEFLQRIILYFSCLSFLAPQWKLRFLIQLGGFLYKFNNEQSKSPKGSPIPVDIIDDARTVDFASDPGLRLPDASYRSVFVVSTLRKKYYYAVATRQEALTWVNSLGDTRQETITRKMGHADHMPYPKSWQYFDSLGDNLVRSKDRIRNQMEETSFREMEMSTFSEGAPMTGGFYG